LPANFAVVWSGLFNLAGVLLSSGAVAFGIISLLPVELRAAGLYYSGKQPREWLKFQAVREQRFPAPPNRSKIIALTD
jgi:hypothetical protein